MNNNKSLYALYINGMFFDYVVKNANQVNASKNSGAGKQYVFLTADPNKFFIENRNADYLKHAAPPTSNNEICDNCHTNNAYAFHCMFYFCINCFAKREIKHGEMCINTQELKDNDEQGYLWDGVHSENEALEIRQLIDIEKKKLFSKKGSLNKGKNMNNEEIINYCKEQINS